MQAVETREKFRGSFNPICKIRLEANKILKLPFSVFVKQRAKEKNFIIFMKNLRLRFKNQKGFNLVELMIVIAIIAILIAVAIPAYQSMVRNGNEVSTIQALQNIKTLQVGYAGKHQGKFAPTFDELIKSVDLDERFAGETPVVNGYVFKMTVQQPSGSTPSKYSINADPQPDQGKRHFYFDSSLSTKTTARRPTKTLRFRNKVLISFRPLSSVVERSLHTR